MTLAPTFIQPDTVSDVEYLVIPYEESNDPDKRAHIVNPPANLHIWRVGMTAQDVVNIARMTQVEVVALCGHHFVPKHNPDKFDACETCMEVAGHIMRGAGE